MSWISRLQPSEYVTVLNWMKLNVLMKWQDLRGSARGFLAVAILAQLRLDWRDAAVCVKRLNLISSRGKARETRISLCYFYFFKIAMLYIRNFHSYDNHWIYELHDNSEKWRPRRASNGWKNLIKHNPRDKRYRAAKLFMNNSRYILVANINLLVGSLRGLCMNIICEAPISHNDLYVCGNVMHLSIEIIRNRMISIIQRFFYISILARPCSHKNLVLHATNTKGRKNKFAAE